jgi:hypothetical protein
MSVNGVKVPLTSARDNATATDTRFTLGSTRDVTVLEVA